jgi:hypothetical protein
VVFAFTCRNPAGRTLAVAAAVRDQDGIWWDDCVELFLDVAGTRAGYRQIIVNAAGTLWDGQEDVAGLQAAARCDGSSWSVEVRIPVAGLAGFPGLVPPKVGTVWYANFACNRPAAGKPAYQRWNSRGNANHRDFSAFGRLRFVE